MSKWILICALVAFAGCASDLNNNPGSDASAPVIDAQPIDAVNVEAIDAQPIDATVDIAPDVRDDTFDILSDSGAHTFDVWANDISLGNQPSTVAVSVPEHGTTTVWEGTMVVYKPNLGFVGTDTFTYTVRDLDFDPAMATVTVNVKTP
jgi:hypothetical protein